MSIISARAADSDTVMNIAHITIKNIYPHYYPDGAVAFFINHHSKEHIVNDITNGYVFLCYDNEEHIVGTVTVKQNEISRLFVLPQYQGNGYGKEMLEFAESKIAESYKDIILDASLPAKLIYLKRGYKEIEYQTIKTENSDFLCFDVMAKYL